MKGLCSSFMRMSLRKPKERHSSDLVHAENTALHEQFVGVVLNRYNCSFEVQYSCSLNKVKNV